MNRIFLCFLCCFALGACVCVQAAESAEAAAVDLLAACRQMLPVKPVELTGAIVLRTRKGIVRSEYDYTLTLDRSKHPATAAIEIRTRGATNVLKRVTLTRPGKLPEGTVMDTDVSWLDLTLDCLWWKNPRFEKEREGESIHGQMCNLILVDPPDAATSTGPMRLWLDKKNGCLLQAEHVGPDGAVVRRVWGTRIKKFGERWMANVLETETPGSGHRTKITVENIREL